MKSILAMPETRYFDSFDDWYAAQREYIKMLDIAMKPFIDDGNQSSHVYARLYGRKEAMNHMLDSVLLCDSYVITN